MPAIVMSKGIRPFFIETLERFESMKSADDADKANARRMIIMLRRARYRKPKSD